MLITGLPSHTVSTEQKTYADLKSNPDGLEGKCGEAYQEVYGPHAYNCDYDEMKRKWEYKEKKRKKGETLYEITYAQQYRSRSLLWTPEKHLLVGNFLVKYNVNEEDARFIRHSEIIKKTYSDVTTFSCPSNKTRRKIKFCGFTFPSFILYFNNGG